MDTYEAVVTRSGEWWAIEVPGVAGAHTQARRLYQVPTVAREAVAALLEVSEDDVEVTVRVAGPEAALAAMATQHRAQAAAAARRAQEETAQVARALGERGLAQKDVAALLGVSQPLVSAMLSRSAA